MVMLDREKDIGIKTKTIGDAPNGQTDLMLNIHRTLIDESSNESFIGTMENYESSQVPDLNRLLLPPLRISDSRRRLRAALPSETRGRRSIAPSEDH